MLQIKTIDIDYAEYHKKVTVYYNDSVELKAAILYFHGGGLLYGTREDFIKEFGRSYLQKGKKDYEQSDFIRQINT